MPVSAMPEHLNSEEEIDAAFPDDEQYGTTTWYGRLYRWYNKATKTMFAFSFRCHEWWARTRKYPIVLFAVKRGGPFRFEGQNGEFPFGVTFNYFTIFDKKLAREDHYLSRIQYWTRWHFAVQLTVWDKIPLVIPMISFHWYPKKEDVLLYGVPRTSRKGKVWFGYWNHFDADLVHWLITSAYFGNTWK